MNYDNYKDIWVFVEIVNDKIEEYSLNLLAQGRILAEASKERLCAVIIGKNTKEHIKYLNQYKIDVIYSCEVRGNKQHDYNLLADITVQMVLKWKPNVFIFVSTIKGKAISSRVAAKVKTGLTADCTEIEMSSENPKLLIQTRPALEGNVFAQILTENGRPQAVTVRKSAVSGLELEKSDCIPELISFSYDEEVTIGFLELLKTVKEEQKKEGVETAKIIVAGGRGVKTKEEFRLLEKLADKLGGRLAVTRPIVDKGWYSEEYMVGQTGKKVSCKLYLAFGISGALQHIVGVDADIVIAVNQDPKALIFNMANYGIVEDCMEVCREMLKQIG